MNPKTTEQLSRPGTDDANDNDLVTPEVEQILRDRMKTFEQDAKAARPWDEVFADLKARRPLPPSPR